jgi:hypothetical protein
LLLQSLKSELEKGRVLSKEGIVSVTDGCLLGVGNVCVKVSQDNLLISSCECVKSLGKPIQKKSIITTYVIVLFAL